ncbi:MAG: Flp pilus assembly complex ATPase component TadA [Gemmatimonadaceae bacterium]|nr:Flp pilus assembly complex ATPase component TadA [Gemmatimonadaceae bacterium]
MAVESGITPPADPVEVERLRAILAEAVARHATDIHIRAGDAPYVRVEGELVPLEMPALNAKQTFEMTRHILVTSQNAPDIAHVHDHSGPWSAPGIGRFRLSLLKQRSSFMIVLRVIPDVLPTFESLGLPASLASIALADFGLILVASAQGGGRSSTTAAFVNHLNSKAVRRRHVVTVERALRFLHKNHACAVTQREIGIDTDSYAAGVRAAMEQDADVIVIGDLEDPHIVELAVRAAEQGRLVIGQIRATDATTALRSFLDRIAPDRRDSARLQLTELLRGVVAQRLLPRADSRGRIAVAEVLLMTPMVRDILGDPGRFAELRNALAEGRAQFGTQTFDQHLADRVIAGQVSFDVAVSLATNSLDFELQLRGLRR